MEWSRIVDCLSFPLSPSADDNASAQHPKIAEWGYLPHNHARKTEDGVSAMPSKYARGQM
jgi:hypothetical protein